MAKFVNILFILGVVIIAILCYSRVCKFEVDNCHCTDAEVVGTIYEEDQDDYQN